MASTRLTDLPPELLDHITTYLPSARSLTNLSRVTKSLHAAVEKDAWQAFNRIHFPSLSPVQSPNYKDTARSLTTLSRAWDRRALVARYTEPGGETHSFPGNKPVERWKRPRGQTIGFTPQLDVYEDIGPRWQDREEVLAFSAGAEICVRRKTRSAEGEHVRWLTYRPLSAVEGRDDVTTLHLLRRDEHSPKDVQQLITGTANGDLRLLSLQEGNDGGEVPITYFATQGQPVRSSSLQVRHSQPALLAANIGDSRISIFQVDSNVSKIAPLSSIDIHPPETPSGARQRLHRIWSTQCLSPQRLAVGLGPSTEPIHVYNITPTGFDTDPIRKFSLQHDLDAHHSARLDQLPSTSVNIVPPKKITSSVYPIVPLPPANIASGSSTGDVFLSGAYDGIIRLHDLRSHREHERSYQDPTDDSAIYSLLPRGQETLVAGTSRHNLLKFFDLRMGRKCYSYLDADLTLAPQTSEAAGGVKDWNLFLRSTNPTNPNYSGRGRGGNNNSSRRTQDSSVYTLASPSSHSPHLYAGVENAVVNLAFTSCLDTHPDPVSFYPRGKPVFRGGRGGGGGKEDQWRASEVLNLAMYGQKEGMKLFAQRGVEEMWKEGRGKRGEVVGLVEGLDERWRVGVAG
ncbi:hypothetical protein LTR62_008678 [Meristemomyces frigidus]|uniref:F-box domain-containing protein n=1 Tax=Meristemomyces frigidus TaxID=1508187 RepID=A0AAN7YCH9_9PEZI|nr:hypothetical protein LTR62_008678 [Meristemomyces frigidus]